MINEQQQEQASLYALGALSATEQRAFEAELRGDPELRELVHRLQRTTGLLALVSPGSACICGECATVGLSGPGYPSIPENAADGAEYMIATHPSASQAAQRQGASRLLSGREEIYGVQ